MTVTSSALTVLIALITSLISPLIVEWIKLKFIHKKSIDVLGESIDNDEKIDRQLEILLEELKCDRVCIAQFHNGGHFFPTGKSIKKFSVFYERTTDKANSIKETFQNIPVSLFPKIFSLLNKEGEIAHVFFKEPSRKIHIIGVTGTNGKTSCTYWLKELQNIFPALIASQPFAGAHWHAIDLPRHAPALRPRTRETGAAGDRGFPLLRS